MYIYLLFSFSECRFHLAASKGLINSVNIFLGHGVNLHATDASGEAHSVILKHFYYPRKQKANPALPLDGRILILFSLCR